MYNKYLKKFESFEGANKVPKNKLIDFLEEEGFNVHLFEEDGMQCGEIEKWTNGGVDMIISLTPFGKREFIKYVDDFDVDEQIDLHREGGGDYKRHFTIRESLEDFEDFHEGLKDVKSRL